MERIELQSSLAKIIKIIEDYGEFPSLAGALIEIFKLLENRIVIAGSQIRITKTDEDLFQTLAEFKLRKSNNISLFRTQRGSIYLFGSKRASDDSGVSIRLELSDDGQYYVLRNPSLNSIFESRRGPSRIPRIGSKIKETFGGGEFHTSTQIVEIDED